MEIVQVRMLDNYDSVHICNLASFYIYYEVLSVTEEWDCDWWLGVARWLNVLGYPDWMGLSRGLCIVQVDGQIPKGVLDNEIVVRACVIRPSTLLPPYPMLCTSPLLLSYSPPPCLFCFVQAAVVCNVQMYIQGCKQPLSTLHDMRVCVDCLRSIECVYEALRACVVCACMWM